MFSSQRWFQETNACTVGINVNERICEVNCEGKLIEKNEGSDE
jgi:hypothetical protein